MAVIYHWKHGWIPLDHTAALKKAKGNRKLADRYLSDAKAPDAGINTKRDAINAASRLLEVPARDRRDAEHQVYDAVTKNKAEESIKKVNVTVTPIEKYGKTYYEVKRDGKPFTLGVNQETSEANLAETKKIAAELPAGLGVHFRPRRTKVIGSRDHWQINDGDDVIATVYTTNDIVPAAKRALTQRVTKPKAKPEPTKPASVPMRKVTHTVYHGDGHATVYYSDGSSYDNEWGWTYPRINKLTGKPF